MAPEAKALADKGNGRAGGGGARQNLPRRASLTGRQRPLAHHDAMRIEPSRTVSQTVAGRAREAGAEGFALDVHETAATAPSRAAASLAAPGALLALQIDAPGRRRRQIKRGSETLDALDRLTLGLLSGAESETDLLALRRSLADGEPTEDAGLDSVLQEIDVRAAVELAKREKRRIG